MITCVVSLLKIWVLISNCGKAKKSLGICISIRSRRRLGVVLGVVLAPTFQYWTVGCSTQRRLTTQVMKLNQMNQSHNPDKQKVGELIMLLC